MSRIILMAVMLAVTVAGCNRFPDLSIQVTANLAPDDSTCTVDAEQTEVLFRGLYDLGAPFQSDYVVTPRIESYIIDNSLEIQGTQGNIQITSFDVTIKTPDGNVAELSGGSLPNPYRVTTSAVIPANETPEGISRGAAAAGVIRASYQGALNELRGSTGFESIILDIRANGTTAGGFGQQSPAFSWPVDFCDGCLGIPACAEDQAEELTGCLPGQDRWTYCETIVPATSP
jgi:hypothetical protein